MSTIAGMMQVETLFAIFAALGTFATIFTVFAPMFDNDRMAARAKMVASERERLKAAQKAALEAGQTSAKLREKQSGGLYGQLVSTLNLRQVFEAEASREKLRTAGLRSERHLTMFLAMRVIAPVICGIIIFIYASTTFADKFTPATRIAATMVGMILGSYLPGLIVNNMAGKRQSSIKEVWSDVLDLLLICIESGMSLEPAMGRVSQEIGAQSVPMAEELQLTVAELAYLPDRKKALENLAKRTGIESVKSVVTAMIQAERYGTPLAMALRVLAEENRKDRMAEAEKKAAALPPKLTVPMVIFFLPVIFAVVLSPSFIPLLHAK